MLRLKARFQTREAAPRGTRMRPIREKVPMSETFSLPCIKTQAHVLRFYVFRPVCGRKTIVCPVEPVGVTNRAAQKKDGHMVATHKTVLTTY